MHKYDLEVRKLTHETSKVTRYGPYLLSISALVLSALTIYTNYNIANRKAPKSQILVVGAKGEITERILGSLSEKTSSK